MSAQEACEDRADGWPPLVLPDRTDSPELPLEVLPAVLRDYSRVVAESAQIDAAIPALLGLGAVAALSQKTVRVAATSQWSEPVALFILALADVSERKTAAYSCMVGPVYRIESELDAQGRESRIYANQQRQVLAQQVADLRKGAAKAKGGDRVPLEEVAAAAAQLEDMGAEEQAPRLAVDDCTIESLKTLMADNSGRISLLSPEAGFLSVLAGAYTNNGKAADMSALLSAYTGSEPILVDRKGRQAERIDRPNLTVVMVGQPRVLEDLTGIKGAQERGLVARFIVARVPSRAGSRLLSVEEGPAPEDTRQGQAYAELLHRLAQREPQDQPPVMRLAPDALAYYKPWHDALEPERGPEGGQWSLIADFAGKAHGLALRFAGLFHLCEHPDAGAGDVIDRPTLEAGCRLADWALEAHKAAVVGLSVTEEVKLAVRLMGAAQRGTLATSRKVKGPWAPFTHRDIQNFLRNGRKPVDYKRAQEIGEYLEDLGLTRWRRDLLAWEWHPELVTGGVR